MPTHASDVSPSIQPNLVIVACPQPHSLPLQTDGEFMPSRDPGTTLRSDGTMSPPASDNTAAAMSLRQEESAFASSDTSYADGEKEKMELIIIETGHDSSSAKDMNGIVLPADTCITETTSSLQGSEHPRCEKDVPDLQICPVNTQLQTPSPTLSNVSVSSIIPSRSFAPPFGAPSIDRELRHDSGTSAWEFSNRRLHNQHPSALLQPSSKYIGTQQSDRQIYNVEVTILTVDMEQCTTSGYLQICGLTPDHPTLTTFFTGEIIGGPDQRFGFRTRTSEWGATDKTDMTHWARFPAWRSLSSQAKQNLDFVHPSDQSSWWQQENIFMRWKEHFLVPDYKLRSIQGASFEGFYYICLNQIEGKISGIYFHSKSEKYQQLELKHEGQPQAWSRGVCPSVEFR